MKAKSQDRSPTLFDLLEPPPLSEEQDSISEGPGEPPRASVALTETLPPFNYGELSEPEAQIAQAAVTYISERWQVGTRAIMEIGNELLKVKAALGHGHFQRWLRSEFGLSERTARRFMLAAKTFNSKLATVAVLPLNTVYELASLPTPLREELVTGLEAESLTADQVAGKVRKKRRPVVAETKDQERRSTLTEETETEDSCAEIATPSSEENTEAEELEHFRKVFGNTVASCNELTPALMPPTGLTADEAESCTDQIRDAHRNLAGLSKRIEARHVKLSEQKAALPGSNIQK